MKSLTEVEGVRSEGMEDLAVRWERKSKGEKVLKTEKMDFSVHEKGNHRK